MMRTPEIVSCCWTVIAAAPRQLSLSAASSCCIGLKQHRQDIGNYIQQRCVKILVTGTNLSIVVFILIMWAEYFFYDVGEHRLCYLTPNPYGEHPGCQLPHGHSLTDNLRPMMLRVFSLTSSSPPWCSRYRPKFSRVFTAPTAQLWLREKYTLNRFG